MAVFVFWKYKALMNLKVIKVMRERKFCLLQLEGRSENEKHELIVEKQIFMKWKKWSHCFFHFWLILIIFAMVIDVEHETNTQKWKESSCYSCSVAWWSPPWPTGHTALPVSQAVNLPLALIMAEWLFGTTALLLRLVMKVGRKYGKALVTFVWSIPQATMARRCASSQGAAPYKYSIWNSLFLSVESVVICSSLST